MVLCLHVLLKVFTNYSLCPLHQEKLKLTSIAEHFNMQTKIIKYKKFYKKCKMPDSESAAMCSYFLLVLKQIA